MDPPPDLLFSIRNYALNGFFGKIFAKIVKNVFYAFDVSLKTINNELVLKLKVIGIV